ncbi:MAG: hypothetical protein Q4C48_03240 [Lachnospiraceae bacterium]|nr:hypothetical protein [Lachnospiraceae bacterium]
MKLIRKILPVVLMIWPYLFVAYFLLAGGESKALPPAVERNFVPVYCLLTAVVYGLNIWNALTWPQEDAGKALTFYDMTVKLVHIPFYIFVFLCGVALLFSMVVPALLFISPFLILCLVVVDFFLMLTSSMYGISAALRMSQKNILSKNAATLFIVLHLLFVADVFGAVGLFAKRKGERS